MKPVSRGQALEISARVATQVDWEQLDGDDLQTKVITLSPEEFGNRFTEFLKAGARFILGGLKVACTPLNPAEFIGAGWTFWRGPKDGNGLDGEEERDKASMTLAEVDFDSADFLTCLEKGESSITGEEKLIRLKKLGRPIYGTTVAMGLWQDYQSCQNKTDSKLKRLYQQKKIGSYVDFFGDILRNPIGHRCVLYFYRFDGGSWRWSYNWLDDGWNVHGRSAVSQQVPK